MLQISGKGVYGIPKTTPNMCASSIADYVVLQPKVHYHNYTHMYMYMYTLRGGYRIL